jgi:hypothetical protein
MSKPLKPSPVVSVQPPSAPPEEKVEDNTLNDWVQRLYTLPITEDDLKAYCETIQYQGFNRNEVLKQLSQKIPDLRIATEIIVAIAVRGPQKAILQKLSSGKTIQQLGLSASGGKGNKILTCNKIGAATADLAAYYLRILNVPKRLNVECPAWLQFPSAASITMPQNIRQQHMEFPIKFSQLIGGKFDENIYAQMVANTYLEPKLKLFN